LIVEDWLKIREILESAYELEPSLRPDFVDQACAGDEALRREVEEYLRYEESAEQNLPLEEWIEDEPVADGVASDPERIGVYRIVRRLGEGGMGVVYLAERDDAEYSQQVALKALKRGSQSAHALRLFRRERQILSQLQHPNIALLMDGGTANGEVFYVMEYVEGSPVTDYCKEHLLTIRQRLELFCRICDAVGYAHRKLIIHRDIKPGNVLVTADGIPKLLDFGLAKVFRDTTLGGRATVSISASLTPAYASPEQVRGEHLNTTADVYSLGVVLYELLTGQNPQADEQQSPFEVCRRILEDEPPPPSHVATQRESSQLRGDLDNIVLATLRKEPEHRYGSVAELREDIERYLGGFPVRASRGSIHYRSRKYLGRHRWGIAVSCLGTCLLAGSIVNIWWQGRQAQMRFNDVRGLAHALIFELHDAIRDLPGSTRARKLIVERALEYLGRLKTTGDKRPELLVEMAAAYQKIGEVQSDPAKGSLGDTSGAVDSFVQARQLLKDVLRAEVDNFQAEQMLYNVEVELADVYEERGDENSRTEASREALSLLGKIAKQHPEIPKLQTDALFLSGRNLSMAANWKAARPVWEQAIAGYQAAVAQNVHDAGVSESLARSHDGLAETCKELEDLLCAIEHYESAVQIQSAQLAASPADTRLAMMVSYRLIDLAWVKHRLGRQKEAIADGERAVSLQSRVADADAENSMARLESAKSLVTTGLIYKEGGELDHAATHLQRAKGIFQSMRQQDPNNQSTLFHSAWASSELGDIYVKKARFTGQTAARSQSAWRLAWTAYEDSWQCLSQLKLAGKLYGILDDQGMREIVPKRLALCRKHLSIAPPGSK
jgi:eukaryotic-like serine/threonine-protein kinase